MGELLSASAVLMCPHGGMVTAIPSSSKRHARRRPDRARHRHVHRRRLRVHAPAAVPSPCVLVQWQSPAPQAPATATPPLTTDSVGMCLAADGAVQGTVLIQSTQTKASGT